MKILIIDTNCSWNKGSAAQVISTMLAFEHTFDNCEFTLLSEEPDLDLEAAHHYEEIGLSLNIIGYPAKKGQKIQFTYFISMYRVTRIFILSLFWRILSAIRIPTDFILHERSISKYAESDLIVDLSGDSFSDDRKLGFSLYNCLAILPIIIFNKPFILYSQSIGPFRWYSRPVVRFCLGKAKGIILREKVSVNYLNALKLVGVFTSLKPDCAFALRPASSERVHNILVSEKIDYQDNKLLAGISISGNMEKANKHYLKLMAEMIDWMIDNFDVQVLLISHVFARSWFRAIDDRETAENIFSNIRNKSRVKIIKNEYTPYELKGIIGCTDIFIGSRMHANIAALSMGVPTITLGYTHKYQGIMASFGLEAFAIEHNVSLEQFKNTVNQLWNKRQQIREMLKEKSAVANESALKSIEEIKEIIANSYKKEI